MKQLIKTSKLAQAQSMLQKIAPVKILTAPKNPPAENPSDEEGKDEANMAYQDELPTELVQKDFVARDTKNGRRAFLLESNKEKTERDYKSLRALQKSAYLPDEKILVMKPKMKQPSQAS